jgi:hypothetical protein
VRIRHRWRSFTIRTLSRSSRRKIPIMRSQIAFARGAPGGLVRIWMPSAVKTASNASGPGVAVPEQKRDGGDAVGEVHSEVAGGLRSPRPGRVRAHPDQMRPAGVARLPHSG